MIAPQPFKYTCPQCGYSKVVKPESDVLSPKDLIRTCPKCGNGSLEKEPYKQLSDLILGFFKK
ncbi:MAG: hypothetical protein NTW78_02110 [Campylobacterales bacterium]|nr:hypothetical protein [Campylobacterales bacterium]